MKDLIFFDKDGYALNFAYNDIDELFEGKLMFDENSTDTFKTLVLNMFEYVKSFSYEDDNNIDLEKFQLFNEHGITYKPLTFSNQPITNIEKVNSSSEFYSKWIEGEDFHNKFPIGTEVYFHDMSIPDFVAGIDTKTFTVVSNKKNAFMVITNTSNDLYSDPFISGNVSSLNVIRIDDYTNLSLWNEPGFNANIYNKRKLSVVNSNKNENIYTIDKIIDPKVYENYSISEASLIAYPFTSSNYIDVKVKLLTDRIFLYNGVLNFSQDYNRIDFISNVPELLTPDTDFIFDTGLLNSNKIFTVSSDIVPVWKNTVTYNINDIIKFEGDYYKAIALTIGDLPSSLVNWESYDINWSESYTYETNFPVKYEGSIYYSTISSNLNNVPTSSNWTVTRNYVIVEQEPVLEIGVTGTVNLTTNILNFKQEFIENEANTLISFYNQYQSNFLNLNIDLFYDYTLNTLNFRNLLTEKSFEITTDIINLTTPTWNRFVTYNLAEEVVYRGKRYISDIASNLGNFPTDNDWTLAPDVTSLNNIDVYMLNTEETLVSDRENTIGYYRQNNSEYYNQTIFFSNIDSFGLNININGIDYNTVFDTDVTNTISDWLSAHSANLSNVGIVVTSPSVGELLFETNYPNVPISIILNLGSLSEYYFKHSDLTVVAPDLTVLNIYINNISYSVDFDTDVNTTINNWINTYKYVLNDLDIHVSNTLNTIHFGVLEENVSLEYYVNLGYNYINYLDAYSITKYKLGNEGTLISSNKIVYTGLDDLQVKGFATAQIISVIGSDKYLNNQNYNILLLDPKEMILSYQGPFWSDNTSIINLKTQDFIRQPRFGFDDDNVSKFVYKWKNDLVPEMFFYDYSGKQLSTGEALSYTGDKPLINVASDFKLYLQDYDNNKIENVNDPTKQRTVFDEIVFDLEKIDSEDDVTVEPEPFQTFIGFNDKIERSINSTLELYFVEDLELSIVTDKDTPLDIIEMDAINNRINLTSPTISFTDYNFDVGQIITVKGKDNTNTYNQSRWSNNGKKFKIKEVFDKVLVIDPDYSEMITESSYRQVTSSTAPFNDINTGMTLTIKVEPKQILRCEIYGQSEEEDERYNLRLNNYGHNINHKDIYIFKEYDISEKGIDWTFLNRKRKELLMNEREIFNHVTAYKSLINAIKFFGYSDLELHEYYRNINVEDANYKKLHKVEIPNIFTNDYTEIDPLYYSLPNINYEKTKLLNLTYRITDFNGDSVQAYSLDEVITKLSGLKDWLQRKTLAVNTKILDITGRTDTVSTKYLKHSNDIVKRFNSHDTVEAVKFDAEGYKQPMSVGSSLYNINLSFSTLSGEAPEYFNLSINTYKTYLNWDPTEIYSIGDKTVYKGLLYECILDHTSKAPTTNILYWKEAKMEVVQTIREFKTDLLDYNFVIDKDVDAFAVIKTSVENGHGGTVTFNKNISLDNIYLLNNIVFNVDETQSFSEGYSGDAFY